MSTSDYLINKLSDIIMFLMTISPYIFLSDTKLRKKTPLFRNYNKKSSFLGMFIVVFILCGVFSVVSSGLSEKYLLHTGEHIYLEEEMILPSCEKEGSKTYVCEYCGETKNEVLPKVLEHDFVEISRQESTVDYEGQIVSRCTVCQKEEIEILEKLPVKDMMVESEEEELEQKKEEPGTAVEVTQQEKQETKQQQSITTNKVTVYDTPTGKRYHYSRSCAGKNAFETTLDKARKNGKTPCKQCS